MAALVWKQRYNWLPSLFLVASLALMAWLILASRASDRERIALETRITAEQLKIRLEACFDARAGLVRTLASYPWQSADVVREMWETRASSLMPLYSGIQALNYVDTAGIIRVIHPVESNRPALNADLSKNANRSVVQAITAAAASGQMTRTDMIELLQSGLGFVLYQQILSVDNQQLGFVDGVFRVESLMSSCLPEGRLRENFRFSFTDAGTVFYEQRDEEAKAPSPFSQSLAVEVVGRPWQFQLAPLQSYLDTRHSMFDEIWAMIGVVFSMMLALVMRSALLKQAKIEENEDKYRLLVENQTDMVVKVNPKGEFQYISPSYCEVFGKSEDELLGSSFMPLVHEDDRELTRRSLASLADPPHTSYHEQRAMTKAGWRWVAWSNRGIFDDVGNLQAITAVGRDVTDIKQLEQSISHSQKMRAMGELAGGITHDFNNLLQVILGNIDFALLDDGGDAQHRELLEQIRNVAKRAVGLTDKLATLSRQDASRPEVFDINEYVVELNELLIRTLPASVELTIELANEPLPICIDKSQLEQALLNLCFNARDAIQGAGRVSITTCRTTLDRRALEGRPNLLPGDYVSVSIKDNGTGIEPDVLPRIFDPFFTTKGTKTGSGLGLSNCYSIVEQHKGLINVEAPPGKGACFTVFLPLAETPPMEPKTDDNPPREKMPNDGKVALIADDNAEIVNLTRMVLEKAGYRTLTAANGREALDIYKSHQSDIQLVVLDLVMPELGGQEVALAIRELSEDVAILLVSGFIPEDVQNTLKEPIIKKPYTITALMEAVNKLF
ncbi:MAG: ATP-binding protein [Pseudomonadota bacterium]